MRNSQPAISPLPKEQRRGLFITFEGIEGSGKTTQCHRLAQSLRRRGYEVIETREPGGTPLAEAIRELLLRPASKRPHSEMITPQCEANLIFACRSQHVAHVLLPGLRQGAILLCDRYSDSTLAYQGYGRGLNLTVLKRLNHLATGGLMPDCTFWFQVPVNQGLQRRRGSSSQNRIDRETLDFHRRVHRGFQEFARQTPRRIVTINGSRSPETIAKQVAGKIEQLLKRLPAPTVSTPTTQPQAPEKHREKGGPLHAL